MFFSVGLYNRIDILKQNKEELKNSAITIMKKYTYQYPIYIIIDSNILQISKNKILAHGDMTINDIINNISKLFINHNPNDILDISIYDINNILLINCNDILTEKFYHIYKKYYDKEINMLIIKIKRITPYKSFKTSFWNYFYS